MANDIPDVGAASRGRIVLIRYRLIQQDLVLLFEVAGFQVKVVEPSELRVAPFRALCQEWQPDLVVSINYSPDLALLCTFVHTPYVSWTIDPLPAGRMAVRNGTELSSCLLFSHRSASVGDFKHLDYKDVRPLLLAAPHERRSPVEDADTLQPYAAPITFVGNSLLDDSSGFQPVLERHQLERRTPELHEFLDEIFEERGHLGNWQGLTDSSTALPEEFLIYVTAASERTQCLEAANGRLAHLLRLERVKALSENGIQVWGDEGWKDRGATYRGIAHHGDELTRIYCASQINLDIPRLYQRDIITMRTFDVLACGGVLLAEDCAELREYFTPDEHLFTYEGTGALPERVAQLLAEPEKRREVGESAHKLILAEHTLDHRFKVILEACYERGWLKPQN